MSLKGELGVRINNNNRNIKNIGNDLYIFSKPDECNLGNNLNKIMQDEFRKTNYLLVENKLIPNIIFLMYLQYYIDKDNIEIFKRNYANIAKSMKNMKNINKINYGREIKNIEYNEKKYDQNKYREVIKSLKERHKDAFIDWLCKLKIYLKNNSEKIGKYLNEIKKKKNLSENIKKLMNDISKIGKKETMGDYLNYYMVFGYLLTVLKIENSEIYENLPNPRLDVSDMFYFKDNLLAMYEYIYQLTENVEPYAIPTKNDCRNFNSIINEEKADCYSAVLNDTFYFTSEISALKNVGENININKYLSRVNQEYFIESWGEIKKEGEMRLYNRIRNIFKGIGVTADKDKTNILYSNSENVIFIGERKDNNRILVKVVCKEVDKNNKNLGKYGRDVISVEIRGRGSKKAIKIICAGREIEEIVMTIDEESGSMVIMDKMGPKYNIIREKDKLYLLNLCDKLVKPKRITYETKDDKIEKMIASDVTPRELVIASIIALIMADSPDIFNKLSGEMTKMKTIC